MPIENRNLEAGTMLTARYKKADRRCEVVQTDGGLRYRLDDGTEHNSPSSAGKAVTGGACNGWVFWSIAGTDAPKRESKAKKEPTTTKPEPKATKEPVAKAPAKPKKTAKPKAAKSKTLRATDVPSYGCGGCGATFGSQKSAIAHALTHTS